VALAPAGLWVRARRWAYLFPPGSRPPGLLSATLIGYMANNVLPLRAGEVARVYVVARRWSARPSADRPEHPFWLTLATLVVERLLDSLVILLVLAVLILRIDVPPLVRWGAGVLLAIDVVAVALIAVTLAHPDAARARVARWTRRWPAVARLAARALDTLHLGLAGVRARGHLAPLLGWTALTWLLPALAAWAGLRALGLELGLLAGWTVLAFVGVGVSVPSAPGYVGVFHAAAVLAVSLFDVGPSRAVGYALVFHASQVVPITLVGWLALLREQLSLGDATRAAAALGE
jgi:uncharacterized membrane protein YbhN (UPF0104 family)